jgi:hypothetical protein
MQFKYNCNSRYRRELHLRTFDDTFYIFSSRDTTLSELFFRFFPFEVFLRQKRVEMEIFIQRESEVILLHNLSSNVCLKNSDFPLQLDSHSKIQNIFCPTFISHFTPRRYRSNLGSLLPPFQSF